MKRVIMTLATLGTIGVAGVAVAQAPMSEHALAGKTVASRFCGECHAVDASSASPLAEAPPMPELYRTFPVERMAEALEIAMIEDHSQMLQLKLDPSERKALTAYLSSFAPPRRTEQPAPPLPTLRAIIARAGHKVPTQS